MKKKKESFWKRMWDEPVTKIIFCLVSAIAFVWVLFYDFPFLEQAFCQQNPDKCVCEEYYWTWSIYSNDKGRYLNVDEGFVEGENYDIYKTPIYRYNDEWVDLCKSHRKLTPQELQAKDCKDNPRDDEDCECVENKTYKTNVTKKYCNVGIIEYEPRVLPTESTGTKNCYYNRTFEYNEELSCILAIPKKCEEGNFILMNYQHLEQDYIVMDGQKYYKDKNGYICRPKTECEKLKC